MRVVWSPRALAHLHAIRIYVARDDPGAAAALVQRLHEATEALASFPESGRRGLAVGSRELVVPRTPYILVYRTRAGTIQILRVVHGAQRRTRR